MTMKEKLNETLNSLKSVKQNVSKFVEENKIKELQSSVKGFIDTAKKDFNQLANKDIAIVKKKFLEEKKQIETIINKTLPSQLNAAKKFVDDQKKEISRLQKKLEMMVPNNTIETVKKKSKKVVKKVTKKAAKK